MNRNDGDVLQRAAVRIIRQYLLRTGATRVADADVDADPERLSGVDVVCDLFGSSVRIKVKPDVYFGTDSGKVADHDLAFYRSTSGSYAFEAISHHVTRQPGWMVNSTADELYYYFLTLDQTEQEVAALMDQADDVFFERLSVERDRLHVLPMPALKTWFGKNSDKYPPRPVTLGDHSGWFRIVPVDDIARAVPGVSVREPVFATLR